MKAAFEGAAASAAKDLFESTFFSYGFIISNRLKSLQIKSIKTASKEQSGY